MITRKTLVFAGITCLGFMLFLSMAQHVHGQSKIDSLHVILSSDIDDSTAYKISINLALEFEGKNPDSAIYYYQKAIDISERNQWLTFKAQTLTNMGFAFFYNNQKDTAIRYFRKGLELFIENGDRVNTMNTYYNLGYFYNELEDYNSAIEAFTNAIKLARELDNKKRLADAYNNLGLIYYYIGHYDKAITSHIKSLKIKEEIGNPAGYTHLNLALDYLGQENSEKALEHNFKALKAVEELEADPVKATALKNIGDIYSDLNQLDSARIYYDSAYQIYRRRNDKVSISRYFMVLGVLHQKKQEHNKAMARYRQALDSLPAGSNNKLLFAISNNMAKLHLTLADSSPVNKEQLLTKGITYARQMEKIAEELGTITHKVKAYNTLYELYLKTSNNTEALKYADKYIQFRDSLVKEQKQKIISDVLTKYETEKKELELKLTSSRLLQSNIIRENQKIIIYILVGGFIIISILIFVILRLYRKTKKSNRKLQVQSAIIARQKDEIAILLKEIHHRIKNNLQIVSGMLELHSLNTDSSESVEILEEAQSRIQSIALIHELLYQSEGFKEIVFSEFVQKLANYVKKSFENKTKVGISIHIPEEFKFNIETALPLGLILNELLTNSFKHAFTDQQKGKINIELKPKKDKLILEVSDNGKGMPELIDISRSKTLGMRLIHSFSQQLNGETEIKTRHGFSFTIVFLAKKNVA